MLKIKTEDITIAKIIENYRSGLWSIPESLSGYEWKKRKNKAVTFIANLYQGRPVSGMTIWEAPEAMDSDGQFEAPKHPARILDGQQKIMTFCKLIDGASDLKILFNPRVTDGNKGSEGQFRVESAITRKNALSIACFRVVRFGRLESSTVTAVQRAVYVLFHRL